MFYDREWKENHLNFLLQCRFFLEFCQPIDFLIEHNKLEKALKFLTSRGNLSSEQILRKSYIYLLLNKHEQDQHFNQFLTDFRKVSSRKPPCFFSFFDQILNRLDDYRKYEMIVEIGIVTKEFRPIMFRCALSIKDFDSAFYFVSQLNYDPALIKRLGFSMLYQGYISKFVRFPFGQHLNCIIDYFLKESQEYRLIVFIFELELSDFISASEIMHQFGILISPKEIFDHTGEILDIFSKFTSLKYFQESIHKLGY
jgi:hypothetical protein